MLYQLPDTAPYTWTRDWDEIADVEYKIRFLQGGDGLLEVPVNELLGEAHAGQSLDLDTLTAYLSMLSVPSTDENEINAQVEAGRELFEALDCAACHAEPHGTNGQAYAVGTGGEYDTPALIALWQSAPYFHDGRADTLYDVFAMTGAHQLVDAYTRDEIENLIVYLRSR